MLAGMGQISDFLDDDDKRREAASAGALQAATPQPATPPAAPPARAAQSESEISRFLADAPPPERGLKGWAQDIGATAVKGAIAVPEIAVGLADMVTGGHAGRAAEGLGLRFKEAREIANDWHSEATKEAQRQFQQAEGVTGKAAAALQNPSVIATAVGESLPSMFTGGLIGRGLMLAGRIGPALAGALGEGIVGAGSAAEQIRQESPNGLLTGRQAGLAGLSGVADAGFGLLGGKMAQRLGIGDVETMLAGAGRAAAKPAAQPVAKGLPRQMAQGALSEGVLEELPQSVSEQALQNIALDRPWQEDVDSAAVLGTLSGGVMGAGASGLHGLRSRPAAPAPLKPSQQMGLDAHGGQLSAAAVVAVDSGASPAALAAAAQQGAQQGEQQGALQESAEAQQAALAAHGGQGPREAAALERVAALDEQLAAARQSLAALDAQAAAPDGAQDEPQQAARAQLAQQVQQLQAEREQLTQGWPRMQAGKALSFGTESGAQLAGHWALAEADQLVTSHDEGLRQNPAYPQQLQPRERSRAASEAQIARMAQRLQPERLAHSADAATGAPIVGADGLVESGNARSIAIKRVYAGPGPQAAAYKDFLQAHAAEFGLMPEQVAGMQKPVLVRVRDTPVNRAEFARQANAPTVAMMSPAEQARADAARMDSMDGLEPDESGDFSGAASRGFVRRFMARLPVSEQAAMVDADGRLSSAGYARVRNAVLAKAWGAGEGGSDALARMTESLDDNTRSISRALMMAAPETARMREAIAAGARHDADIAGDVAAAAQEISRLREAGQSVQQALAQTDAFGDKHTPEARALMQFMADNARRPRRIAKLIQAYWQALDAAGDPHQQGMFDGQAAPTKQALLQAAMRQVQDAPAQGAAPESAPQERETQDRAQAAWNALPLEGRHQLALAAGVQGVVARNAARHADWSSLPAAMQQRLAQAVGAASAAPGRDNAAHKSAHETAHKSPHESGVPRGLAARGTADSRQLEGIINRNLERSGQEAAFKALAVGADQLPDALRGALAAFERATGARAVVFRNLTPHVADFNGVTVRDGTLFINEASQSLITGVAAHEWLHNLRRTHPALYHELAAEVARQGDAQGFARQWGYAPGEAQEELTAAAVGDAMTDPQFLARLAEKDGSLFARVAKSFLAFLDTLTARWRSQGGNAYLRDVQAFRDKLAAVLQAYEQQAGQAGGVGQAGLPQAMFQRVWHGTPHKGIEKTGFRLDKIGTGEGLQVYGHGIYFASRREVAEFYRGMRQGQVRLDGRLMTDGHHRGAASTGDPEVDALLLDAQGDVDKAMAWARDFGQDAQAAKLERLRGRVQRGEPGQLYAAEIPEDDDLLDWDKPLDGQPAKVRRALLELAGGLPADGRAAFRQAMARRATGQDVYAFLAQRAAGADASAEGVQKGQRAASELLLAHGIPGLRYLDGDSRNAGEGSHNYVIWDEGLLTPEAAQIAPQYSRKLADGFYSALQKAVENAPMKAGDAQAWKQYLTGQINKGAVKEDEVFWSGVREWLDAQQGKVSRQGVQDWLAGSHVRIEPVQLDTQYVVRGTDEKEHVFDSREEAQQFYDDEMDWAASASGVSEDEDEISIYDNDETTETITREAQQVWLDEYGDEVDLERYLRLDDYTQEDGDTLTVYDEDGDARATFTRGEIESWKSDRGREFDSRGEALEYAQEQADGNNAYWKSLVRFDANERQGTKYHDYSFAGKGDNYRELLLTAQAPESNPAWKKAAGQVHLQKIADKQQVLRQKQDELASSRRLLQQAVALQQSAGQEDEDEDIVRVHVLKAGDGHERAVFVSHEQALDYALQVLGIPREEAARKTQAQTVGHLRSQARGAEHAIKVLERDIADLQTRQHDFVGESYNSAHWDEPNVIAHTRLTDFEDGQTLFVEELQSDWAQDVRKGEASAHAPFVDSTGKWLDLLLKKVLLQAAEGGYARVAFIGGQQSADRYSLDKQISRIEYANGHMTAHRKDGGRPIEHDVQPDKLEGVIGREAAQKLLDAPVKDGVQVIEGDDLKMGGEGMRAFYDNVVPKALGKLLKKADKSVRLEMREQPETGQKQLSFEMTPALREKLDEGLPLFSRKQATKAAYERRIDELFAGGHASRQGAVLLDGSDVMGLLGHEHVPLVLNERHLLDGRSSHPEMTAAAWKRVPEWLENPAAVYDDPRHPGRLTAIAPETLAGYPVVMAVELEPDNPHDPRAHQLLVTAFAKTTGDLPALGFLAASGRLQYVDTKTAPVAWPDTGDVPRTAGRAHGAKRILTEKSLAAWRKAQAAKAGDAPAFSLPESRASRQVKREASALKVQQAQRLVKALSRGWANAPEVVIASSVRDDALPETARRAIAQQESRSAGGRVEGFYWQGKVYLVAGNLPSMHDVARVYMHETLGHYGLRGVYGEKLNSILNRAGMAMRGGVIERARQYGFHGLGAAAKTASDAQVWDSMTDKQKLDSAEEALAYLAQTGGKVGDEKSLGLLRELVAAIRSWLRAHVPVFANLRYSDDEIMREFILPARRWVKNGSGQADDASDVMFQLAWHGTPYRGIEKTGFKLNKIGTGEGAQAYGWGIYFASQRHVAEEYRRNLTRDTPEARYEMLGKHKDMLDRQIRQGGSYLRYDEQGQVIAQGLALKDGADMKGVVIQPYSKWKLAKLKKQAAELEAQMNELRTLLGPGGSIAGGQLYQTEVPEDKDLLIWDSPWNKQPLKVRRAVVNFLRQVSNGPVRPTQSDIPRIHAADDLKHRIQDRKRSDALTGKDLYTAFRDIFGGPKAASEALHAAGVPGLRYLDGMRRAGGKGTYNYVIWDEALLTPEAAQIEPMYSLAQSDGEAVDGEHGWGVPFADLKEVAQRYEGLKDEAPKNSDVLVWERLLSRQPTEVQRAVDNSITNLPRRAWDALGASSRFDLEAALLADTFTAADLYGRLQKALGSAREASLALRSWGIRGLRFDDNGQKGYVIWDKALLPDAVAQKDALQGWELAAVNAANDDSTAAYTAHVALEHERDGVREQLYYEAKNQHTLQGQPIADEATLEDEDALQEFMQSDEFVELLGKHVDEVLASEGASKPLESLEDIDKRGTHSQAAEAVAAALDEMGVPYERTNDGFDSNYIFVRRHDFDEDMVGEEDENGDEIEDIALKLRFADHGNQSIYHSDADYNWVSGEGMEGYLREIIEAARDFYAGNESITGGAHFSRRAPEPLEPRPDEAARLKESALEQLDRVFKHPGTVSWWHKTVGTMRNLAERQPLFKPVYEAAQQFIDDVSHFANDAADFAPRLLPRLESWRDLGKRAVSAADSQAVAAPLFEGTLSYTRGKDGSLVKTDNVDAAGVVFTDAELKGRFGLTPAQIELYRQARAAIDRSIDTTARADILRLAGRDFAHLRQAVMDAPDLRAAAVQVVEAMQEVMRGDAKRRDAMRKAIEAVQERVQTAQALMQRGYAPLTRFGRYTLDVVDAQGQRQYFGLYESRREANVAAIHMRSQYPGAQVTQGTLSDDAYKLFAGITPESLELFGDLLAAPGQGKDKGQDQAFQAWLQLARNNRSAIKRLIHRKGVAGYSQDAGRVLASFIYANARQTAGALNAGRMDRAIAAIPKEQGQLRDVAMALRDYTQNPREEGQAIRGMLFAQYLGGSLASAAVNMTQPFAVTLPWLSQFGGMRQAAAQMTRALADMTRPGHRYEADLARDMAKAEEDGVVSPQEIHQLMAQARGAGALRSGDGTRRGDALAAAANAWERLKVAWGQPFALAEQFNRRSTYIAAWRLARQQGMADADAFARRAVLETQFVYTKANKPRWGRGAVGGALFTFKTYSVSYLELMHRMWTQGGTPGKQGVAWMLAMLLLMGGAGGLPFMEDAEDLVDGLAQLAGYNTSAKQWRQQALQDIVGDGLAEFIESGVSGLPGAPIDISGRLGMGNLLPGTGLLLTKQNRERDLLDVAGPAGDLLARGFTAGRKLLTGDAGGAAMELAPTAVRNLAKGADMLATGSYRDAKGYKVLDTTALEALAKAAGFQPRSVAQVQEGNSFLMRSKSFYQHTSAEIKAQWARALFEKDEAALQRVRQRVADWNRRNPEQPITVRMPDIWRRVREMGKERSQRIADSAPRALRQQMRQALAQEG